MANHLVSETSPYLKMHAENPVDWFPWGEEALEKARAENKPILLSIGYTACHWCHVMAHESFEDEATAQLMNKYFVNIKVDREERPDLDKIYQLSAQLLTRQVGGWPLTVFLMPNKQIPFFAGTYFPPIQRGNYPAFKEVLLYVHSIFEQNKEQLEQQNISFEGIIKELEEQSQVTSESVNVAPVHEGLRLLRGTYDSVNGGFNGAPKFPMPTALQLFHLSQMSGDENSKKILMHSLQKMSEGGIYDQIGNGFFRYTVDEKWQIPHFEKMLYDNAQLLTLFTEVYAHNQEENSSLKKVIRGTADWILREMQSKEGAFYSTLAADTEGKEGKFYVWTKEEVKDLLSDEEYEIIEILYGLNQYPNFQHTWHFRITTSLEDVSKQLKKTIPDISEKIDSANTKIFNKREKRVSPERDEKIIVSWNGLTIKALALAGLYLDENKYIESADQAINFIFKNLWINNQLYSIYKDGLASKNANLDDYVFLIEGIFNFLQTKWSNEYFTFMQQLVAYVIEHFEDKETGGFYFTSKNHEKLIYRLKQYTDESLPSSNAVVTKLLSQIGYLLGDNAMLSTSERSLKNAFPHLQKYPDAYCSFLASLAFYFDPSQIIIVRGNKKELDLWKKIYRKYYHPNRWCFFEELIDLPSPLNIKKPQGDIVAYFCKGSECKEPIKKIQDFENELRSNKFRIAG